MMIHNFISIIPIILSIELDAMLSNNWSQLMIIYAILKLLELQIASKPNCRIPILDKI